MPAANSIATHEPVLNSGSSSSAPSLISPYFENAMTAMMTRNAVHNSRKYQSSAVSE